MSGNNMHITWRSYATPDSVAKVVEFYERERKTSEVVDAATGERKFVAPSDPDTTLSAYSAAAATAAKIPTCPNGAPKKEESAVILVSQAVRPRK